MDHKLRGKGRRIRSMNFTHVFENGTMELVCDYVKNERQRTMEGIM
jgi:hypothetical protein